MDRKTCICCTCASIGILYGAVSAWMLYLTLPSYLLCFVLITSALAFAFALVAERCRLVAMVLSAAVCAIAVVLNYQDLKSQRECVGHALTDLVQCFGQFESALLGLSWLWSSAFLVLYSITNCHNLRQRCKRVLSQCYFAPKPRVQFCTAAYLEAASGQCCICLDELADCERLSIGIVQLPCRHVLHWQCGRQWLQKDLACPMCRHPMMHLGKCTRIRPSSASSNPALREVKILPT